VVIAVIAIIAAIAIPNIANVTGAAQEAKNQRNAQTLASLASQARAAGYNNTWADLPAAITDLCSGNGAQVTNGTLVMSFRLDGLSAAEQTNASTYLGFDTNSPGYIIYQPTTN